jgi:hypothetical protein
LNDACTGDPPQAGAGRPVSRHPPGERGPPGLRITGGGHNVPFARVFFGPNESAEGPQDVQPIPTVANHGQR